MGRPALVSADRGQLKKRRRHRWELPAREGMRVPGLVFATRSLVEAMDAKVFQQMANVATLPGILEASYAMPDAHWGYGFPIGGVAAFDPEDGVVSAGGVGFDISCGVRCLTTGLETGAVREVQAEMAEALYRAIPAGVGSRGRIRLGRGGMDAMLAGGARWAVEAGHGQPEDLERTEEQGCMAGARPDRVSNRAKERQGSQVGTLGSGNHYLEVQRIAAIHDPAAAAAFGLREDQVVISIHCGSRGLGHQVNTDFLKPMVAAAARHGIPLPDRELACAPIASPLGQDYLGAMRAGINCALANRQVLTHLAREVFDRLLPRSRLEVLYDVSHNTCKEETHRVEGRPRRVFVHRKGATRAFPPGHPDLPPDLRAHGQPVLIGGSMGTASYVLTGMEGNEELSFSSSCHGAGRRMSRSQAKRSWNGREVVAELERRGILVRSPSMRGVAEEAPGAYKPVEEVVDAAEAAGLSRKVARLEPLVCVKG